MTRIRVRAGLGVGKSHQPTQSNDHILYSIASHPTCFVSMQMTGVEVRAGHGTDKPTEKSIADEN